MACQTEEKALKPSMSEHRTINLPIWLLVVWKSWKFCRSEDVKVKRFLSCYYRVITLLAECRLVLIKTPGWSCPDRDPDTWSGVVLNRDQPPQHQWNSLSHANKTLCWVFFDTTWSSSGDFISSKASTFQRFTRKVQVHERIDGGINSQRGSGPPSHQ